MIKSPDFSDRFALDVQGVNSLRSAAGKSGEEGLKAAATQFEALFLNQVLKSLREASPKEGMFDSEQTRLYTSMLDQQLSQTLASRGAGLAQVMVKQLNRSLPPVPGEKALTADKQPATGVSERSSVAQAGSVRPQVADFRAKLMPHALEASQATGVPARFMLAQAALESGWGKREVFALDGTASHNLFGLKAGRNWKGPVVEAFTTEYVNGVAQKKLEKFRAYASYAEAFRDYAQLLRNNPRYAAVLERKGDAEGFAQGLQQAGYATDPDYANKLTRIIKATRWT